MDVEKKSLTKRAQNERRLRLKRKPGPKPAESPSAAEQDMAHAVYLLDLISQGKVKPSTQETRKTVDKTSKRLTALAEQELAIRVQTYGDIDARNELVSKNLGLVHLVANQFFRPPFRYEDLAQEGILGLIRATETFDPDRGIRFSTYSVYWIRAKIQRLIQKNDKDDRPDYLPFTTENRESTSRKRGFSISFETTQFDDSMPLEEVIASKAKDPEKMYLDKEKETRLRAALKSVAEDMKDHRMHALIGKRLLTDNPESLTELGKKLDLSREGVRLLEKKILRAVKKRLRKWQ